MAFTVTYNGNTNDAGSVPVDPTGYANGATVTVLGPGSLSKTGDTFAYWNTAVDDSGTIYGPGATFTISANVTLYAEWYTADGLTNSGLGPGVTTHYSFVYVLSLKAAGIEPARTNLLIAACEDDFTTMSNWFGGLELSPKITTPYPIRVATDGGGAGTGGTYPNISTTLHPGTGDASLLRYLVVSELTEVLMYVQGQGWSAPDGSNEMSCGEGLSRFLAQQFLVEKGLGVAEPGYAISPSWLNSSLPSTTAGSSQLGGILTTLSAAIDNAVTSIPVVSTTTIPYATSYIIQIDNEQMLVNSVDSSAKTLSVTRGYNGTTRVPHATKANVVQNYGSRADYVNVILEYDHGIDAATGCAMLFLYYLQVQLGFSINSIVTNPPGASNAGSCLRVVYRNLTGDDGDPFPFFKQLLDNAFPPDQAATIPGPNPDNPWPLGSLSFAGGKNTWGKDEVTDIINKGGVYPTAFYLALEGFNLQVLGTTTPSIPTIAFSGATAVPDTSGSGILLETSNPLIPQRISFPYDAKFTSLGPFPSTGETPAEVDAAITVQGAQFSATSEFFFLPGADPYFTNVQTIPPDPTSPTNVNVPWLSEDLRVFTATPGAPPASQYQYPVPGGPQFVEKSVGGNYDIPGAYNYIQALLLHLNQTYGDPSGPDPFDPTQNVIPGQSGAYTGDSSVTPTTQVGGQAYNNYSFAIARVRLRGSTGSAGAATGVRVFFRLWQTQTADTDWQPTSTYLSNNDPTSGTPLWPEAPPDDHTIPFFATSNTPNFGDANDPEFGATGFTNTGVNNLTITINQGDSQWSYFGCFLNVNDSNFVVNGLVIPESLPGTHHCLVAQIAYPGAPIQNVGSVIESPENSDQLAQRNLQVTTSDNPGPPSTHRVPQTFDVRPSPSAYDGSRATYPDELMIDWGNTPVGSVASIYWPQANTSDILTLAASLYGTHSLSATDAHTLQCKTHKGVTYVPIPYSAGGSFAGLFTLELPRTVVTGQEFDVVVRRIGTRMLTPTPPPLPTPKIRFSNAKASHAQRVPATAALARGGTERYIVGSFQVKIPVTTPDLMLPAEETTLAIFKARIAAMAPSNRWYPVLLRYIGIVSGRVDGLGGNASAIPPSVKGYPIRVSPHKRRALKFTGKVSQVIFDCHGEFVGFVLCTCSKHHHFPSRERAICDLALRACHERLRLSVVVEGGKEHKIKKLIIRP